MRRAMIAVASTAVFGALATSCGSGPGVTALAGRHAAAAPSTAAASADATGAAGSVSAVVLRRLPGLASPVLVGNGGRTLYLFAGDLGGRPSCVGACLTAWPPDLAVGTLRAGPGVSLALLGIVHRGDGTSQVTYHGHPLYYYQGDTDAGSHRGEGVRAFGGLWYLIAADGHQITG